MKIPPIFSSAVLLGAVSLSLAGAPQAPGQTVSRLKGSTRPITTVLPTASDTGTTSTSAVTDPVGFTSTALLANSDSLISIPFTRPAAFTGAITAISGGVISVSTSANFTANQFVYAQGSQANTYYAIVGPLLNTVSGTVTLTNGSTAVTATAGLLSVAVGDELIVNGLAYNVAAVTSDTSLVLSRAYTGTTGSGLTATYDHSPKEGSYYTVTANGTNTLTVNLNGDSLSTVAVGTSVTLIPYWTLGTAFPATDSGVSYSPSSDTTTRGTQILMPNLTGTGVNLSSPAIYYFLSGNWRRAGQDPTVSQDDTVFLPTTYFTVRNTTATTFTPTGSVFMNRISSPLDTLASGSQDNAVSVPRPVTTALNDLGLVVSGAFTPGTDTSSRGDLLLVYDNTLTGFNKSASAIYYYLGGAWRQAGQDPTVDYGSVALSYGTGLTVRKQPTANGATVFWQNTRNY